MCWMTLTPPMSSGQSWLQQVSGSGGGGPWCLWTPILLDPNFQVSESFGRRWGLKTIPYKFPSTVTMLPESGGQVKRSQREISKKSNWMCYAQPLLELAGVQEAGLRNPTGQGGKPRSKELSQWQNVILGVFPSGKASFPKYFDTYK